MSEHAPISMSGLHRSLNCLGSYNACKDLPKQPPNKYAAEGTVAHELAASALERIRVRPLWSRFDPTDWALNGKYHPDGIEVTLTAEMVEAVQVYIEFVQTQEKKYDEQPEIERKVKITDDCWGTADSIIYSPYRILIVNDYKHGTGIQVDAEMNEQLLGYAYARLKELPSDEGNAIAKVQMNIIQPRGAGEAIKTFEMHPRDLIAWAHGVLYPAIEAMKKPNAKLTPGDWCKYCPAALTCPALKKTNLEVAKLAFQEPVQWIDVLTPKQIADLLDKESVVMAFYKRLNEHAAELASKNVKLPGYTYQKKFGHRKWKDGAEALFENFPNAFETKLKSPSQIEKLKLVDNLKDLCEIPFTGWALKKSNGKEITVKEVFAEVE
jgi:hypothetical protein